MTTASINALDLYFTSRVEGRFQELRQGSALKSLRLWNFPEIDAAKLSWEVLPPINSFEVYKITPLIAAGIARMRSVKKLKLAFTEPTPVEVFSPLTRLTMLETLHVHEPKMVEMAFVISKFIQLSSLKVEGVTPELLDHLSRLPRLKSLHMFTATTLNSRSFANLTGLQKLDITNCESIAPESLESLTQLTHLRLFKASLVYTELKVGVKKGPSNLFLVAGRLTCLEILNLDRNGASQDSDLVALTRLTDLRGLNLSRNPHLTEEGLVMLTTLTALRVLNIYGCNQKNQQDQSKLKKLVPILASFLKLIDIGVSGELQETEWWKTQIFLNILKNRENLRPSSQLCPSPVLSLFEQTLRCMDRHQLRFPAVETLPIEVREKTQYPIKKITKHVFH